MKTIFFACLIMGTLGAKGVCQDYARVLFNETSALGLRNITVLYGDGTSESIELRELSIGIAAGISERNAPLLAENQKRLNQVLLKMEEIGYKLINIQGVGSTTTYYFRKD